MVYHVVTCNDFIQHFSGQITGKKLQLHFVNYCLPLRLSDIKRRQHGYMGESTLVTKIKLWVRPIWKLILVSREQLASAEQHLLCCCGLTSESSRQSEDLTYILTPGSQISYYISLSQKLSVHIPKHTMFFFNTETISNSGYPCYTTVRIIIQ